MLSDIETFGMLQPSNGVSTSEGGLLQFWKYCCTLEPFSLLSRRFGKLAQYLEPWMQQLLQN
eukprot:4537379-Amphidinium_carterae.1